jgi:hypothetical protein
MTGVLLGIVTGIVSDVLTKPYVKEVHAETAKEKPKEVKIEIVYNWTPEKYEEEIRKVFIEEPNTAVAVAKSEGGLKIEIQSKNKLSYGREKSFCTFQIHAPDHEVQAKKVGLGDFRTNPRSCIKLAHLIYKDAGGFTPWTKYRTGEYKKFL